MLLFSLYSFSKSNFSWKLILCTIIILEEKCEKYEYSLLIDSIPNIVPCIVSDVFLSCRPIENLGYPILPYIPSNDPAN